MSKESGGFLRKVARFVANPTTDWAALDTPSADSPESEYAKTEIKAMIERKRRNDFVRKRELDMLRKIRREGLSQDNALAMAGSASLDSESRPHTDPRSDIAVVDKRFFQGLPSPAAAALVMGLIWVVTDLGETAQSLPGMIWLTFGFTLYAGLTMVTNIPFYSFKDVNFRRTVPFITVVAIALGIAVITIHPPIVLFGVFVIYGLSGYGVYVWKRLKGKPVSVISTSTDEPDERGLHR